MAQRGTRTQKTGQRIALIIAVTGVLWVLANLLGAHFEWSNRIRALFDLMALAGFGLALWQTLTLWRSSRNDKG